MIMVGASPTQGSPRSSSQAQALFVWENSLVLTLRATFEQLKVGKKKVRKPSKSTWSVGSIRLLTTGQYAFVHCMFSEQCIAY
jgi:hypothetical protein